MRKRTGWVILSAFLITSCGKNDTSGCQPVPVESENTQLVAYSNTNGVNYTLHSSGLLYEVVTPGTGMAPNTSSTVSVTYVGRHMNNSIFDSTSTPYTSLLSNFIDGWKIGLPLIKKGGRIKLVIPSALAYSCQGSQRNGVNVIQPNEPLFFDVTLTDVK
jgi:FKBP-type peptidyl-prolyl cis-trans isomerase